jgi:hypothetical protein
VPSQGTPEVMSRPASSLRPRLAAVTLGALLALAAACSSTSESQPPTADDTTTSSAKSRANTTVPIGTSPSGGLAKKRIEVVRGYEAAYNTLAMASTNPAESRQSLPPYFQGESLTYAQGELDRLAEGGIRVTFPSDTPPVPSVTSVTFSSPTEAQVEVCLVDNGVQVRAATGEILDDQVVSRATRGTLKWSVERWKLASAESTGDWNDGNGCER